LVVFPHFFVVEARVHTSYAGGTGLILDESGIFGIILGVVESRVSQLRYLAMRQIHDWLAEFPAELLWGTMIVRM
jgi:hypothetical protein